MPGGPKSVPRHEVRSIMHVHTGDAAPTRTFAVPAITVHKLSEAAEISGMPSHKLLKSRIFSHVNATIARRRTAITLEPLAITVRSTCRQGQATQAQLCYCIV